MPRVMRESPVLAAARHLVGSVLNRDHAAAREWPDIGTSLLVKRNVPTRNRPRPVVKNPIERIGPFRPVRPVIRLGDVGTSFGPIRALGRKCIMNPRHSRGLAHVSVPCDP